MADATQGQGSGQGGAATLAGGLPAVQFAVGVAAGSAAAWLYGWMQALSLAFGAGLMALSSLWVAASLARAPAGDPEAGRRALLKSAAQRMVAMLAALAVAHGLGLWLPMVAAGMFLAMLASWTWALARLRMNS